MSNEITTAFVQHYSANVQHLAQQKGSRLRNAVRVEMVRGKTAFFDQIGAVSAKKRTARHADTPQLDTPHSRRRVALVDYDWADLIDQNDQLRLLTDPSSNYAQAAAWAIGRAMDDAIVEAADATAYTGEDGSSSTVFDTGMIVDVQEGIAPAADTGLNIGKLLEAKRLLDAHDVDPDIARYCAVNARQLKNLLNQTEVKSADYNTVKALVQGDLDTFLGFKFLRTERIGKDANNDDKVLFWARDGLLLALGSEPTADIGPRRDKNMATQVFYSVALGAARMEETKVGYIECDPN